MPLLRAEVELVPGAVQVEVAGVYQRDADPAWVTEASEAIRLGVEQVLRPRRLGAIIRVSRIVVHPVDL